MRNAIIDILKWPVAFFSLVFAWFATAQLPAQVIALLNQQTVWIPLVIGVLSYFFMWRFWLRTNRTVAWAAVLEHELTHVIASLVTFNGVHRLQADSCGSGHIAVSNNGNWIILAAPYVFPTALLIPGMLLATAHPSWAYYCFFGLALGFHIQSTCAETHFAQTDLKKIGWPAVMLLLPAYHIIFALCVIGVLIGNQNGLLQAWKRAGDTLSWTASSAIHSNRKQVSPSLSTKEPLSHLVEKHRLKGME